ncbi:hypothetical protein GQ53DRAFT_750116 [Thozetella sp. PMI_491]|nr:hypothetical protein GQ53DRAFT_750116 [Thozetella sp. PMI_491]
MSFVNLPRCPSDSQIHFIPLRRPGFHHQNTTDRLREGSGRPPSFSMVSKIKKDRKSMFKELGLDTDDTDSLEHYTTEKEFGELTGLSPATTIEDISERGDDEKGCTNSRSSTNYEALSSRSAASNDKAWYSKLVTRRPKIKATSTAPPGSITTMSRFTTIALLIGLVLPGVSYYNGVVDAGVVRRPKTSYGPYLDTRADSPTQVCKRWSHQSAMLNGTLYIYGGQAKTQEQQVNNTWNNNFVTIDLTKSWDISSPPVSALPQPSGPPAVANGYLWNDYNHLFLYGGEFADNPFAPPAPASVWQYTIASRTWAEFKDPKTSAGNNSDGGGAPVQRAAEGAGVSVPELGTSWYFGGHLDLSTTPGWSDQVTRVYLKSLLEFTHPGYTNNGVQSLADGTGAGEQGVFRNITQGGLQTNEGFSERADGILAFIPGWGESGVLLGLGGGTNDTFSNDMSVLDVYDIANSVWYHQQTKGEAPSVRVNPCAVVASAPDASSFQLYLYGGQNLQPYKQQTQYSDMYILTIPSFTWIKVDQGGEDIPSPRAGQTCTLRDGQIVLVGGYIDPNILCDSPGIYVFNASSLAWASRFTAFDHRPDLEPGNSVLAGSYGYQVPAPVVSVIGGGGGGGATATTPAAGPATGGPFATGKPPVFTVTAAGNTATVTQWGPGSTSTSTSTIPGAPVPSSSSESHTSTSPGLVVAGVLAGLAGLAAAYLGYCTWLHRRQVAAYQNHLAVANRYSQSSTGLGGLAAFFGRKGSDKSKKGAGAEAEKRGRTHKRDTSTDTAGSFTWVPPTEPKGWLEDHPTPDSGGYSSASPMPPPGYAGPYGPRPVPWVSGANSSATGSGSGTASLPSAATGSGGMASMGSGGMASVGSGGMASIGSGGRPSIGGEIMEARPGLRRAISADSDSSTENLLEGQEPSFFSVVMGPRRALRVVNGLEGGLEPNDHH